MAQVRLENLTKVFTRNTIALKQISLNIADGEFMVIVGPSGCGKTTTLRLIAGLQKPTSGKIIVGETIVNNLSSRERDIAMVFQNYALYPHMTVFKNMAFGLKVRKYPKAEIKKRVEKVAKLLEIKNLLGRKPATLSGGQCQRVAVGRAIVRKPKVFLFDEPLSNLDASVRLTTRTELKALHYKLKTTSIYVTHDQTEAMTLGDRICVLYDGVVQQVASPLDIYDKPSNRFVAGFFGNPPMNFIEGNLRYRSDQYYFTSNSKYFSLPARIKDKLTGGKERQVVLGIRPEYICFRPIPAQHENSLACCISAVEQLGSRMNVHLETDFTNRLVANVDRTVDVQVGKKIKTYIDLTRAHLFESNTASRNITAIPT